DPSHSQMLSDTAEFDSEVYFTPKENEWDLLLLHRYHLLASDDSLWKPACMRRWANKKHIEFRLNPRVDYSSLLDRLSVKEMKEILKAKKSQPHRRHRKVRNEAARTIHCSSNSLDGEMEGIDRDNQEELCSFEWAFRCGSRIGQTIRTPEQSLIETILTIQIYFMAVTRKMTWRFYLKDVQVEQYPPLTVTRSKDWGYVLDNGYAFFRSLNEGPRETRKTNFHAANIAKG
ncbi:hypothetical protein BC829DRAFT_401190, partial [Chytridium lagenaria]